MSPALFWLDERTSRRTAQETTFQRPPRNTNALSPGVGLTFGSGRNNQLLLKSSRVTGSSISRCLYAPKLQQLAETTCFEKSHWKSTGYPRAAGRL